ncbi:Helix-turn-helix, AraC type [gamma proteobacterium IMCC1989]|nr:Helix-turn-helix, AraC type [gamma proteobacterium IMCC1989]
MNNILSFFDRFIATYAGICAALALLLVILLGASFSTMSYAQAEEEKKWQINFKDSDIQEVIKFVADITGKTVIIDPRVKGKVKVISANALSEKEIYDLFLSVLETQGFTAIEVGNIVRVIPRKDARTSAVPVVNQPNFGTDAYITQVIQLYNVSASKVLPVLRPLAPQHAHLAAYEPSNAIIVSDTVANIARLTDIIERIDRAGVAETDVMPLEYAQAAELATILQQLSKNDQDSPKNTQAVIVADQRSNSILVTGDQVRRNKVRELVARLDVSQPQSGNVRVIYLEYADAEEVATVLAKVVSSISKLEPDSAKGAKPSAENASVEADPATNSLLITADADTMESLLSVIKRLDIRRAQVLVEAIIVEITNDLSRELGVEWAAYKQNNGFIGSRNSATLGTLATAIESGDGIAGAPNFTGQGLGFFGNSNGVDFAGLINFFQGSAEANVLSTPSLLTTDNNEAEISIGQNVPFVTGSFTTSSGDSTDPFQTIEREDVGISLKVTPQINEGDTVNLEIQQEVSSISNSSQASDVITNERKISTKVIAQDGETIILGGLISNEVRQDEQKVPFLGDIPLLGGLFRNDSTTSSKQNLMVFLRATILRSNKAMAGATGEKYRYIRDQQIRAKTDASYLLDDNILPLLPVWDEVKPDAAPSASQ